jgi:DNA-binding XRE family transcriptional regulator
MPMDEDIPMTSGSIPPSGMRTMDHCHFRGLVSFSQYVSRYTLVMPRPILPPKGYPLKPVSLGDHLRKKRLDLGLYQAQVAERIGVTKSTVYNWEHGREPDPKHHPKIVEFLGYTPMFINPFPGNGPPNPDYGVGHE